MSFLDMAFDNTSSSVSNPLESIGGKLFEEINPMGKNQMDNLNIVNSMRSASALPEGFPSFDNLFDKNLPTNELFDGLLSGGFEKALSAPDSAFNSSGSFTDLVKGDGIKNIFDGQNPFNNLIGGERSFLTALSSAPQMLTESGFLGRSIPGMEQFGRAFEAANPASEFLSSGSDIAGGMSQALGGDGLGGILGSLGLDGISGGPGGLLGSLSGLLGEGGIGSLIGSVTDIIGKILPLIAKLAPLALAII